MRVLTLSALALSATTATAYLNTSPFFLFSTSKYTGPSSANQIETASKIGKDVSSWLSSCPTKSYILVSQPRVLRRDYVNSNLPTLSAGVRRESAVQSSFVASEVLGNIEGQQWKDTLVNKCKATSMQIDAGNGLVSSLSSSNLIEVAFPEPSKKDSVEMTLEENDAYLASIIDLLPSQDYTVLYTTTAFIADEKLSGLGEQETQYEMETPLFDMPHTELKRDLEAHKRQNDDDKVVLIDGPLFDRYQFFTPGVWMGFSATLLLVGILYVGVSALAGLQVTYAAFDKENGPNASRKTQ